MSLQIRFASNSVDRVICGFNGIAHTVSQFCIIVSQSCQLEWILQSIFCRQLANDAIFLRQFSNRRTVLNGG